MNYNSEVLYYQANIGADPDFRDLKMTIAEALILIKRAKNNGGVFSSIKDLNKKELLSTNNTDLEIYSFQSHVKFVDEDIFSLKAKELGYVVLYRFDENFLCYNDLKKEFVIWVWYFHDKAFGRGTYSFSYDVISKKWREITNA
ncbi:hypothetical protein [Cetobacterium sp.]|uniref:hypothetical protein n=1 Tax=Cetobacterium sp. TaxID=2071632 RepID=UPI003F3227CC